MNFKKRGIVIEEINANSFMEPKILIKYKIKFALALKIWGIAFEEINANSFIKAK